MKAPPPPETRMLGYLMLLAASAIATFLLLKTYAWLSS